MKLIVALVASTVASQVVFAAESARTTNLDNLLGSIESELTTIEKSKRLRESTDLDNALDAYLNELQRLNKAELEGIEKKGRSLPAQSSSRTLGERLAAWEDTITTHRPRVEKLVTQIAGINAAVYDGRIIIPQEVLRSLSKDELKELPSRLSPEILRNYERANPDLLAVRTTTSIYTPASCVPPSSLDVEMQRALGLMSSVLRGNRSTLEKVGDFIVPRADAAVAAGCVVTCAAAGATVAPCVVCVADAIGIGATLTKALDAGLGRCNSFRWRWMRRGCKAALIAAYIGAIG